MENDFIVGFTLYTPKGFRTMYRHFNLLETARLFASNINIKENCKIYVDLDYFNKNTENHIPRIEMYKNNNLVEKM